MTSPSTQKSKIVTVTQLVERRRRFVSSCTYLQRQTWPARPACFFSGRGTASQLEFKIGVWYLLHTHQVFPSSICHGLPKATPFCPPAPLLLSSLVAFFDLYMRMMPCTAVRFVLLLRTKERREVKRVVAKLRRRRSALVLGGRLDHALAVVAFGAVTGERLGTLVLLHVSLRTSRGC